jgi:lysophospholipase L1-like esterase
MRFAFSIWCATSLAGTALSQFLVKKGWTAFGDSYAAGIGAGADVGNSGDCSRRAGAYPVQFDPALELSGGLPHGFNFIACSGAKMENVQTRANGQGQVDAFRTQSLNFKDVATISIGGNDVGFALVLEACIFRAKFFGASCAARLAEATTKINNIIPGLEETYRSILRAAHDGPAPATFKLIVTGTPWNLLRSRSRLICYYA